jgi:hypothetical protein
MPALPFKLNHDRRHHIPRQRHKVTNWPAYEAGLCRRGSLTVWFTDEAIFECVLVHRQPDQRCRPPMLGDQLEYDGGMVVSVKLGPVHGEQ